MNERILELQIQAEAAADEIFDRKGKMYGEIVMEKFAELIVLECAKACEKNSYLALNGWQRAKQIREHFGVKE